MEKIINPVSREILQTELSKDHFVRTTNNGSNEIYIIDHTSAPNVMREIGRLREYTFRAAGGGTGKALDLDEYDTMENPFLQLLVWNPEEKEIVGGYRYILCRDLAFKEGKVESPTARLFRFNEPFIKDYLNATIELGRSFVQPAYQPVINVRKGMYSLDNLWDGLGALIVIHPEIRYFFGKITMYTHFDKFARDLILFFLHKYFPDPDRLVEPYHALVADTETEKLEAVFTGSDYESNYRILVRKVRDLKESIPPLVNAYMNLSSTMRTFGTSVNDHFGDVEETGIMVTIDDIYERKVERHLTSFKREEI